MPKQTLALVAAALSVPLMVGEATAETPAAATPATANRVPAPAAAPATATGAARASTVVATVNDEPITLGQMIAMRQSLHQDVGQLPETALWDVMLDQIISQTAVAQVAAQSLTERDKAMLENDRRGYLAQATLERVASAEPTEAELHAAYDKAFDATEPPRQEYSAAHILVKTEEEAKAIADDLSKGADFGKLAEEKSTDNSGANKGDLGWFTPDMMVKPFADAVVALKKGEVSAPVQSQFGWHIIRLNDIRTMTPPQFDAIRDQLVMQVRREKVEAEIQKQVSAARIEKVPGLEPALINKTELLDK